MKDTGTTTMAKVVAKAMAENAGFCWDHCAQSQWESDAHAAIEAMRSYFPNAAHIGDECTRYREALQDIAIGVGESVLSQDAMRARAQAALTGGKEAIPTGVYYSHRTNNFHADAHPHIGLGNEFYARWRDRANEFPHGPSPINPIAGGE